MKTRYLLATCLALALLLATLGAVTGFALQSGTISGVVFCDRNGNWEPDAGEGLDGIDVLLYDNVGCDWPFDDVLRDTQATAGGGAFSFTALPIGTVTDPLCYWVVADELDPDLGMCDFPMMNGAWVELHEELTSDVADLMFAPLWEKTVDGEPWVDGFAVTVETSDTIQIVDTIYRMGLDREAQGVAQQEPMYVLTETWSTAHLTLVSVEYDAVETMLVQGTGALTW